MPPCLLEPAAQRLEARAAACVKHQQRALRVLVELVADLRVCDCVCTCVLYLSNAVLVPARSLCLLPWAASAAQLRSASACSCSTSWRQRGHAHTLAVSQVTLRHNLQRLTSK